MPNRELFLSFFHSGSLQLPHHPQVQGLINWKDGSFDFGARSGLRRAQQCSLMKPKFA